MTQFLFFRHGETDWNLQGRFQGHTDIALNSNGKSQADLLAKKIQHWKPDVLLSSDLARALQTAQACQSFWNVPIVQSSLLREMNLGQAEGLHRDEVKKLVGADWEKWVSHNPDDEKFRFPQGESKADARKRILDFLEKFSKENPQYKKIAVSTHGGVLRQVTHALTGTPAEGVPIPNCVTYRLNWDTQQWHYLPVRERTSAIVMFDDKILTFRAVDPTTKTQYQFLPGGRIEIGETPIQCVERECIEETGYIVKADEKSLNTREYEFEWDGNLAWCRTHFFKGELINPYEAPLKVQDADYNKGTTWIPTEKLDDHFAYHEVINAVVKLMAT